MVQKNAESFSASMPEEAKIVKESCIVDNCMSSNKTEKAILTNNENLIIMFDNISMDLHKITSNSPKVLKSLPPKKTR